ncbi:hypothetical protein FE257_009645 [Aspergillus nanangensis]|uniref:fumarylacetoacetase n=1 Tax=Aspergillus nanangensis TaxID=2582783 RepID=A0AAD4CJZ9_ASPNN|nr:hypothetical protein FE257_009645 [Aspergillus nanangensis]
MVTESWLSIPQGSPFSLANIPFGIITSPGSTSPHSGIAIGDHVLDLHHFAARGGFAGLEGISPADISLFSQPTLNPFAAAGQAFHRKVRSYLQHLLMADTTAPHILRDNTTTREAALFHSKDVKLHLPMEITGYTDFFAGKNHAYNCGCIFRDPQKALQPNYLHLPVGYSSRASSVVVSGTPIQRPLGQYLPKPGAQESIFGPCQRLDIELELGALLCKPNPMGRPIGVDEAEEYIFGFVLLNDWSARDIQAWEAVPLGPFNAKNFASSISPWVVLKDALEPFRTPGMDNEAKLHPYLRERRGDNMYDINLEVDITRGCPMRVGDLIGSGTISGTEPGSLDIRYIQGLPSVPSVPIFGNLFQLGSEHPKRLAELSKKYGPVFQIRLGNRRFVVANTFESVKELWIKNQSNLISRPTLHTFHNVLSSSQGFTIGTSPWDESCKRRRKAAGTAVNRPAVASYMPFVDLESYASIKELHGQIGDTDDQVDLNAFPLFQRLALNLSLTLGYGFRIDGTADDDLLREIINVERGISTLRSTSNNWQDFVPLLRMLPSRNDQASDLRMRRDKYLEFLLQKLMDRIAAGTDKPCITGNIIRDPDQKLNHEEIKSICLTMIAGGLDTTPACILLGLAVLSGPQGQTLQDRILNEIHQVYPNGDAWTRCLEEETLEYLSAFCKEVLRFWTVIPMSLPRVSVKDMTYQGACIPAGTTFLMNAWAADYDETHFKSATTFAPERFLNLPEGSGTLHFAFGAGSRMCTGSHLAMREMYVSFVRMLLAFKIRPARDPARRPILTGPLECNANPSGLSIEPKDFDIGFQVRDRGKMREPKRPRALQACEVCRARKNRCNEDLPCSYCVEHDLECIYSKPERAKRRATLQAEKSSKRGNHQHQSPARADTLSRNPSDGIQLPSEALRTIIDGQSQAGYPQLMIPHPQQPPASCTPSVARDAVPISRDSAMDVMDTNSHTSGLEFYGASSSVAFLRHVENISLGDTSEQIAGNQRKSLASILHNTDFQPHSATPSSFSEAGEGINDRFHFRVARTFLEAYFSNIHYIQPIFDEEAFFARCEDLWFDNRSKNPVSFTALYYATLSLGSLVMAWDHGEVHGADRFFEQAAGIITQLGSGTDLEMVQCYYMMGKVCQHELNPHVAYLYSGQATRTALAIGLNRSAYGEASDPRSSITAAKTWWAVYCLDIQTSFSLGRPDSLGPDEFHTQSLPGETGSFKTSSSASIHQMLQIVPCMVKLSRIMRRVSLCLYGLPCSPEEGVSRATELDAQLDAWLRDIPSHLKPGTRQSDEQSLKPRRVASYISKQSVVLMIRYYNLRMIIYARSLTMSEAVGTDHESAVLECQEKCIESAGNAIDLIYDTFRNDSFFQTWWYNSTYMLFAVSVLLTGIFHRVRKNSEAINLLLVKIDKAIAVLDVMDECVVTRNATKIIKNALSRAKSTLQKGGIYGPQGNITIDPRDTSHPSLSGHFASATDSGFAQEGYSGVDFETSGVNGSEIDWGNDPFSTDESQQALFWIEWGNLLNGLGAEERSSTTSAGCAAGFQSPGLRGITN